MEGGVVLLPDTNILTITNRINIITTKFSILLQAVIKGTKTRNTVKGRTAPWWTAEYTDIYFRHINSSDRFETVLIEYKELLRIVCKTKCEY